MTTTPAPPDGWTSSSIPHVDTKGDTIRIECQCSVCHGAGIWRDEQDPRIGHVCTNCRGGGRSVVYLTAYTGRKTLDGITEVRASGDSPELPYERWLETVVPVEGGAVEYRIEGANP